VQVVWSIEEALATVPDGPAAVAFGNFDGVHLGHRALLDRVVAAAGQLGGPATIVTFQPHPLTILRPDRAPAALDDLAGRLHGLAQLGTDRVLVLPFDAELASQSALWFAQTVLLAACRAKHIVVGHDTRFGQGGQGDVQLLHKLGAAHGIAIDEVGPVLAGGEAVSSSRIRRLVAGGEVAQAWQLLRRPFALSGPVVTGDQRGRQLGFPTANVAAPAQVQPAAGVYAGWLQRSDGQYLPAVVNAGTRPTFAGSRWQVEAHVLDFAGDLYGESVRLLLGHHLRPEQRFDGLPALLAQIERDVQAARVWTASHNPLAADPTPLDAAGHG
jgi:riboflavin kinase/FMN adenylyltransferase